MLATGFCGGFTTFSAFANENLELIKNGEILNFSIYMFNLIWNICSLYWISDIKININTYLLLKYLAIQSSADRSIVHYKVN